MKRRKFITLNMALLGGVVIGRDFGYANALTEAGKPFKVIKDNISSYDLIINGAGLMGCFAALEASKKGLKVLLIDKRTSPGFEIAAKRKLWLNTEGCKQWDENLSDLFVPEGEKNEIFNRNLTGFKTSCIDDQLLLFAGSLKKGLLRSILVNNIDLMLMTDVWGVLSDKNNTVSGVTVACKQGVFSIPCQHFIDATDNNFFSRNLLKEDYSVKYASFVLELDEASIEDKVIKVDSKYRVVDNQLHIYKGKKSPVQRFISFKFETEGKDLSIIEQKARAIAVEIAKDFPIIHAHLQKAKLRDYALECSFFLDKDKAPKVQLKNYACLKSDHVENYSCASILDMKERAVGIIRSVEKDPSQRVNKKIHYAGKIKDVRNEYFGTKLNESGKELPLYPFAFDRLDIEAHQCKLLIAGGGTAGVVAALGAAEKGCKPTIIEYYNDLGGSKTMGGVLRYYLGLNKHEFIVNQENKIKEVGTSYHMSGAVLRSFYHLNELKGYDYEIINGSIICGAKTSNNQLNGIAICNNGILTWVNASLTIDSTGDADIAYFAGEGFDLGNTRMNITQNYSLWDIPYYSSRFPLQRINKDYGIINNTYVSEMQRALYLSHYEANYYDFYPMLAVRESRRPHGVYTLDVLDVLEQKTFDDTIANACSDFDPHSFGHSEYTRCAFLLPHSNKIEVNIPYRCIVPKKIDGLLLSGRGISLTHNALQFTRMSADIMLLGYVTGQIAADIISQGKQPRNYSVTALQRKWAEEKFLFNYSNSKDRTLSTVLNKLADNKSEYLSIGCQKSKDEILPELIALYKKQSSILLAKSLAWFGNSLGNDLIREELEESFRQELQVGHFDWYFEEYDSKNLYWHINQSIGLLGMSGNKENNRTLLNILKQTTSGGAKVKANNEYDRNRVDLYLVPFYNRIINLCFYIERNPDISFIDELNRLLDDKHIKIGITSEYQLVRWSVYSSMLELSIGSAAARCGSKKGLKVLVNYLDDIHSDFRNFAYQELKSILNKDFSFDTKKWKEYIDSKLLEKKVTPLDIPIEL